MQRVIRLQICLEPKKGTKLYDLQTVECLVIRDYKDGIGKLLRALIDYKSIIVRACVRALFDYSCVRMCLLIIARAYVRLLFFGYSITNPFLCVVCIENGDLQAIAAICNLRLLSNVCKSLAVGLCVYSCKSLKQSKLCVRELFAGYSIANPFAAGLAIRWLFCPFSIRDCKSDWQAAGWLFPISVWKSWFGNRLIVRFAGLDC